MLERARTPLQLLGWTIVVAAVVSQLVMTVYYAIATYGESVAERMLYVAGNGYTYLGVLTVGAVLLFLAGKHFSGALAGLVATGLLLLNALVVLVIILAGASEVKYGDVAYSAIAGGISAVIYILGFIAYLLMVLRFKPERPQYGPQPFGPAGYQGYPQQYPQQQPYPQQYPQQQPQQPYPPQQQPQYPQTPPGGYPGYPPQG